MLVNDIASYENVLETVLLNSKKQAYKGYNKHDGLNSPFLYLFFGWSKWPRLIAIQSVMRCPVNVRPILGVKKSYNPKGLALFVQAHLDQYSRSNSKNDLQEAESLLELLIRIQSTGDWSGSAWGYHYPWQDLDFYAKTNTPNAVVTAFVCEAFLEAFRITGKQTYLDTVRSSIKYFLSDLIVLKNTEDELCLSYMPIEMSMRVMDVSILIGTVIAQYCELSSDNEHMNTAKKLVNFVINNQTEYGAWFYTDPPGDSFITHDNYHTGFILDALWRYMQSSEDQTWMENYNKGLRYYYENLFTSEGAPRWMNDKKYPYDIHGAAQGILTFSRHNAEYPGMAEKILNWTLMNMYLNEGRFIYQIHRRYRKNFTLLRWCNGWMSRAMAQLLLQRNLTS